jgi:hypothetical protein
MLALVEDESSIDFFTLSEELRRRNREDIGGGAAYLASLTDGLPRAWRKDNGQFFPHPATWLNNRQREDSLEPDTPEGSVWDEFVGKPGEEES